jgi:hypothetical protein
VLRVKSNWLEFAVSNGPLFDVARMETRLEHLMTEMERLEQPETRAAQGHKRLAWAPRLTVGTAIAAVVIGVAAPVGAVVAVHDHWFAAQPGKAAMFRGPVTIVYQGKNYTPEQISALQKDHKALYEIEDPNSADHGLAHAFDTQTELDGWRCAHVSEATNGCGH